MANVNLGQITGVWIENTVPPHTNLIWIKTINQSTGEKAGFVFNGNIWINIQGFRWLGVFDSNTDYIKNDVVLFSNTLYIKLNGSINNDTPNINSDFDLFLPSTPSQIGYDKQVVTLSTDDEVVYHNHGLGSITIDVIIIKHISLNDRGNATLFGFETLNPTIANLNFKGYLAGDIFTVIVQSFE
jgi:hypothetical protein